VKDLTYLLVATELLIGNHKTVGEVPRFALGMTEFFYTRWLRSCVETELNTGVPKLGL